MMSRLIIQRLLCYCRCITMSSERTETHLRLRVVTTSRSGAEAWISPPVSKSPAGARAWTSPPPWRGSRRERARFRRGPRKCWRSSWAAAPSERRSPRSHSWRSDDVTEFNHQDQTVPVHQRVDPRETNQYRRLQRVSLCFSALELRGDALLTAARNSAAFPQVGGKVGVA